MSVSGPPNISIIGGVRMAYYRLINIDISSVLRSINTRWAARESLTTARLRGFSLLLSECYIL